MSKEKLNFIINEYLGPEVFKFKSDGSVNVENTLQNYNDIHIDDKIAIPILTNNYITMIVNIDENGKFYGKCSNHLAVLEFNTDNRHCWICMGLVNIKSIEKLEMYTKDIDCEKNI